jgi:membrane-associated HD superfamily phosphohydrolase
MLLTFSCRTLLCRPPELTVSHQGCTLISTLISLFLIYKHASNYTNRNEQRQIMRILFMVPIYSITTMFSYVWYWRAVYWTVARMCSGRAVRYGLAADSV